MTRTIISSCGVLGAFLFIIASILGGLWIEGYSSISQFISESYATGIPNAEYLRYMYIASGIFLAIFGFFSPSFFPKSKSVKLGFLVFAIFYGLGGITVALFPCDFGCPSDGETISLSQFIHNTSGFLTYVFTPVSIIGVGLALQKWSEFRSVSKFSLVSGCLAFVFVALLFSNPEGPYIGLMQRIIEFGILLWVVFVAIHIKKFNKQVE